VFRVDHARKWVAMRCEECKCRIPAARLKAIPTATRCVACQTGVDATAPRIGVCFEPIEDDRDDEEEEDEP